MRGPARGWESPSSASSSTVGGGLGGHRQSQPRGAVGVLLGFMAADFKVMIAMTFKKIDEVKGEELLNVTEG